MSSSIGIPNFLHIFLLELISIAPVVSGIVPIMIIGIGYMENVARVNYSKRNSWKTYTQFLS